MATTGEHGIIIPDPSTAGAVINDIRDLALQVEAGLADVEAEVIAGIDLSAYATVSYVNGFTYTKAEIDALVSQSGTSVAGNVATYDELPATAEDGQSWIVRTREHAVPHPALYTWSETLQDWSEPVSVQGAATVAAVAAAAGDPAVWANLTRSGTRPVGRGQETIDPRDFGAKEGLVSESAAALAAAFAAGAAEGVPVTIAGRYQADGDITVTAPVRIEGAGKGVAQATTPGAIRFAPGVGMTLTDGAQYSSLRGLLIASQAGGQGSGHGLTIRGRRITAQDVNVTGFGGNGFNLDTTNLAGNANLVQLSNCRASANGGNGFHIEGVDSNVVTLTGCDAMNNAGWGFWDDGQHTLMLNPHAAANGTGAFYLDGNSPMILHPYVEIGQPGNRVVITDQSVYGVWIAGAYGVPTPEASNPGARGWVIISHGGFRQQIELHDVGGRDSGKRFVLDNGVVAHNTLRLRNVTDLAEIFRLNATRMQWSVPQLFTHAQGLQLGSTTGPSVLPVTSNPEGTMQGRNGSLALSEDGTVYSKAVTVGLSTGWRPLAARVTGSSGLFNAAGNPVNTVGKAAGSQAWNTTTNRPIWATGPNPTDPWVFADGTTAHTPA